MKKITKSLLILLSASVFLFSCGEDDEPTASAPSITVTAEVDGVAINSGDEVEVGSVIDFTVDISAPGGVNTLWVGDNAVSRVQLGADAGATTASYSFPITITDEGLQGVEIYAVDDIDQSSTTVTYNVTGVIISPAVVTHTATLLGGQLNATENSFYNAIDDAVYSYASFRDNNSASTDFLFFYGETNMYTIAAIDDTDASTAFNAAIAPGDDTDPLGPSIIATRNQSRFKALTTTTVEDFDAIATEADLLNVYGEVAASETKVNGLEVDDVFAFVLDEERDSKVGIAKVTATGGTTGADRTITIQVKIQPDSTE